MKYVHPTELPFDFENRRALIIDGSGDEKISLITVDDFSNVIARAIDFAGEWPIIGGIRGTVVSIKQLISLGEKVRGASFEFMNLTDKRNILISQYQEVHRSISKRLRQRTSKVGNGKPRGYRSSVTLRSRLNMRKVFQGSGSLVSCWLFPKMPILCQTIGISCFRTTSLLLLKTF